MFCYLIFVRLKSKSAGASKKSAKAAKDPNKPKRPASAFFVFMYISLSQTCHVFYFQFSDPCFLWNFYWFDLFVGERIGKSSGSNTRRNILTTNPSLL